MADTLKDFLISIGYKVDQLSQRQAEDSIRRAEERATDKAEKEADRRRKIEAKEAKDRERERAKAEKAEAERRSKALKDTQSFVLKMASFAAKAAATVEASALGVVYAVDKAAQAYSRLNYMSQRTGAKPGSIGAFGYASSQLGSSTDQANASLEAFGQKLRLYGPGYAQALERLGVKTKDAKGHLRDTADIATDLGDALRRIQQNGGATGYTQAIVQAKMFGFDEVQARAMMSPDFRKREGQYRADQKAIGADPDGAAKSGTAFEQSMGHLNEVLGQIETKVTGVLFEKLKPLLDQLADWFAKNGDRIAGIVARVADDLVKLATAIADKIAGADWNKILTNVESLAKGFDSLAQRLTGDTGLTALFTLFGAALAIKVLSPLAKIAGLVASLSRFVMPPWLTAMLGVSVATDVGTSGKTKTETIEREEDEVGGPGLSEGEVSSLGSDAGSFFKKAWRWSTGRGWNTGDEGGNASIRARGRKSRRGNAYIDHTNYTGSNAQVVRQAAKELGTTPEDLATVIGYETGGTFSPGKWGGAGGNYMGLIQFGPSERKQFGANDKQTFAQQMPAVVSYLKTRGYKPGMGLLDLYSTINAGSPGHYNASDGYGTVRSHVARMQVDQAANVKRFLGSPDKPPPMATPRTHLAKPLAAAPPLPAPGTPQGLKRGGYAALGLGSDGRPARPLGHTPALQQSIMTSNRGDTNVTHSPTFNITGGDAASNFEAARRMASRGQQDLLRNLQGAEQ